LDHGIWRSAVLVKAAEQRDRLQDGELLRQARFLQGDAQALPQGGIVPAPGLPEDLYLAGGWGEQSFQDFDGGRLARAIGPQESKAFPDRDFEVEAVDGVYRLGAARVALAEVAAINGGSGQTPVPVE